MGRGSSGGKASAKSGGRSINFVQAYDDYTSGMTKMQKGRVEKVLEKPTRFDGVQNVRNEKEMIEYAIKNGAEMKERTDVRTTLVNLKHEGAAKQFDYAKREEGLREADRGAFIRGTTNTPLTKYLRNGDSSALPAKYKTTEYQLYVKGDGTYFNMSKTSYEYYNYLKKNKGRNSK